ncbi:hypothetical protein A6V39_05715 [Candidatus Mycoplasma haematobovis]|uniref:Uncharacterized protein n=1 Tax=Candidatus Mycoplasma haematobovis TaxID=432608 RepID=A0A1A9QF86_9MOLU|nr:hypothetical protein [Candidatus Mycoplasma haematobovis]OAL10804.1 hypothetical protein A6V39_05715 [Candidatus Mycoplasma haematobovis]
MPNWDDDEVWRKRYYEGDQKSIYIRKGSEDIRMSLANPKELRDACYGMISDKDKEFSSCNSTQGWCSQCLIDRSWYNNKYKNIP